MMSVKSAELEFELGSGVMCAGLHQRRRAGQIGNLYCLRCENENIWVTAVLGTSSDLLKSTKQEQKEKREKMRN